MATLLSDGKVLIAGGSGVSSDLIGGELYDPETNVWVSAGWFSTSRWGHSATLLPNGRVLAAGGALIVDA